MNGVFGGRDNSGTVRLTLRADQPDGAAAQDRLVDPGHILAVEPDVVSDASTLADKRDSRSLDR